MRSNLRRRTAVATAMGLPRYPRNDKVGTHGDPLDFASGATATGLPMGLDVATDRGGATFTRTGHGCDMRRAHGCCVWAKRANGSRFRDGALPEPLPRASPNLALAPPIPFATAGTPFAGLIRAFDLRAERDVRSQTRRLHQRLAPGDTPR